MAVRTDAGLAGLVFGTSGGFSLVQQIANRDLKIAAKIERTNQNGLLIWQEENKFILKISK
jgi:hypothetical protein